MSNDKFEDFLEDLLDKEEDYDEQVPAPASELDPPAEGGKPGSGRRNPFKFLDAYTPEDSDIFFGRGIEIAELYRETFSNKVTVVFGNSGTGKTSLVQCGLFSRVKPEKAAFYSIRSAIDPLVSLKIDCIGKILAYDDDVNLFQNLSRASRKLKKTLLLFFDQFEEIFILQPPETRGRLAIEFKQIIQSDLDIRIILGIREEYFARLIEFERVVPDILSNRIWVRKMSVVQAETVILEPCRLCGVEIGQTVAKKVIAELSEGQEGIELPYIQVVMDNLYRQAIERNPNNPVIEVEDLKIQGGIKNILSNFIKNQISNMQDVELVKQVLKSLITAEGTKRIVDVKGIADTSVNYGDEVDESVLRNILRDLVDRRILREDPDNGLYELRHDTLANIILQWMTGIEQELMEVRQAIENRFKEYQTRRMLLDAAALKSIAPYESRLRLKPEVLSFIEHSKKEERRKRNRFMSMVATVAVVFMAVIICFGIFAYLKSIEATEQAEIAIKNKILAEDRLAKAKENLGLVLAEKTKNSFDRKNYNAAHVFGHYALDTLNNRNLNLDWPIIKGITIGSPRFPITFSTGVFISDPTDKPILCFSPDGNLLALGGEDNVVQLLEVATGKKGHQLIGHMSTIGSVCFSPDGEVLASGSEDAIIKLWDVRTGQVKLQIEGHADGIQNLHFSPDGKALASGSKDKTARVWDMETGREEAVLKGHTGALDMVRFLPDGKALMTWSSYDWTLRLWDLETGMQKSKKDGVFGRGVRLSPDGKTLASWSGDNAIHIWNLETEEEGTKLTGHNNRVRTVNISPDGQVLASSSEDGTIRLWDIGSGREEGAILGAASAVSGLCFSPDGKILASISEKGIIRYWDVTSVKEPNILKGHQKAVIGLSFSPDGGTLASGSPDKTVRLWDVVTGKEKARVIGNKEAVFGTSFSPDGKTLAFGIRDGSVRLWDVANGKERNRLTGHEEHVFYVSFAPDGKTLASGSRDDTIRLWDVEMQKQKTILQGHQDDVYGIAFSPNGKILASGSKDTTIRLWNVETGQEMTRLGGHDEAVFNVSFSPDGKTLVSGSKNGLICLWDVPSGQEKDRFTVNQDMIFTIRFAPDGKALAWGSSDNGVYLWGIGENGEKAMIQGHDSPVYTVVFSPDGQTLASGSSDNTVRLWNLSAFFDSRPIEARIKEAETRYNLRLLNLVELESIPPEEDLIGAEPAAPQWPKSHPFHWLSKAESGDADAMIELGIIYDRDNELDKAWHWYTKALEAGSERARERIIVFKQWLTLHRDEYPVAYENYVSSPDPLN